MSPNITKVLGYALTDASCETDPRINTDSPLLFWSRFEEEDDEFAVPDLDGYAMWLEERQLPGDRSEARLIRNALEKRLHFSALTQCVIHGEENQFADTLVIIPPAQLHRWYRSADSIDWWEASLLPDGKGDDARLDFLPTGPSPYTGRFMDLDGTELNAEAERFTWLARQNLPADELDWVAERIRPLDPRDDRQPYASAEAALPRIVPYVPSGVRNLAEYGQLFTGPDVWKQLRPVLYTYWS